MEAGEEPEMEKQVGEEEEEVGRFENERRP